MASLAFTVVSPTPCLGGLLPELVAFKEIWPFIRPMRSLRFSTSDQAVEDEVPMGGTDAKRDVENDVVAEVGVEESTVEGSNAEWEELGATVTGRGGKNVEAGPGVNTELSVFEEVKT